MRIGDRKTWITLQCPTKVGDVTTYINAPHNPTVKAKITTLRTDEAIIAMASTGTAIHNINIRYRSDVRGTWRIKFTDRSGDKYFNIFGPPIDVRKEHRELDIKVKEAV
jgi:SPP1 family predicted phage head-tail adaptor